MAKAKKPLANMNLSEGIRSALLKLGVDASAKDVATEVCEAFPMLSQRVHETGNQWDNYVSGQRRIIRGGNGSRKPKFSSPASDLVTIGDLMNLSRIKGLLKNPDDLPELVGLVIGFGTAQKVDRVVEKFDELVSRYENEKKAIEILNSIRELGLTL